MHRVPSPDGGNQLVRGNARVEWVVGGTWLRHEFDAEFPGRGRVSMTSMMSYIANKERYNFYMFDHFGGEAGLFTGDWADEDSLVLTAQFGEDDGSTSHQKITVTRVSDTELWLSRAFSDDGEYYHFESKGVYTRKP